MAHLFTVEYRVSSCTGRVGSAKDPNVLMVLHNWFQSLCVRSPTENWVRFSIHPGFAQVENITRAAFFLYLFPLVFPATPRWVSEKDIAVGVWEVTLFVVVQSAVLQEWENAWPVEMYSPLLQSLHVTMSAPLPAELCGLIMQGTELISFSMSVLPSVVVYWNWQCSALAGFDLISWFKGVNI